MLNESKEKTDDLTERLEKLKNQVAKLDIPMLLKLLKDSTFKGSYGA